MSGASSSALARHKWVRTKPKEFEHHDATLYPRWRSEVQRDKRYFTGVSKMGGWMTDLTHAHRQALQQTVTCGSGDKEERVMGRASWQGEDGSRREARQTTSRVAGIAAARQPWVPIQDGCSANWCPTGVGSGSSSIAAVSGCPSPQSILRNVRSIFHQANRQQYDA